MNLLNSGRPPPRASPPPWLRCAGGYKLTPIYAARRAHAASARAAPPPERERAEAYFSCAHAQESCSLEAPARTSERGRASRERAVSLAQRASKAHKLTPIYAARRAHAASARAARCASSRERARRGVFFLRTCARKLLVGGRGWHIGAWPCIEEEAASLAQWASMGHGPTPVSTAQHARAASAHAAPPPERELAVDRSRLRTRERRLLVGGRGLHVKARPCTEGKDRLDGAADFRRA